MANTEWYDKNHSNDPSALQGRDSDGKFTTDTMGGTKESDVIKKFFRKSGENLITIRDAQELVDIDEDDFEAWIRSWEKENSIVNDVDDMDQQEMVEEIRSLRDELESNFDFDYTTRGDSAFGDVKSTLCNLRALKKVSSEFPLYKKIVIKSFNRPSSPVAGFSQSAISPLSGTMEIINIEINRAFFTNSDTITQKKTMLQTEGYYVKTEGTEGALSQTMCHEYGHCVSSNLFRMAMDNDDDIRAVREQLGNASSMLEKIQAADKFKTLVKRKRNKFSKDIMDKVRDIVGKEQFDKDTSEYGKIKAEENLAEMFSSYYCGAPSPSSEELIKILKEMISQ